MSDPDAPDTYVRQLIEDAKLVIAYGARTGKLVDDTLAGAVSEAQPKLDSGKPGEIEVSKLAAALSRAVQTIAPVTPLDLGSSWRPYPMTFWRRAGVIIFAAYAILLTVATGYYTYTFLQANTILSRLVEIHSLNVQDKSERLFRFVLQNYPKLFSLQESEQDGAIVEAYLRSYQELIALNTDISVYLPLAQDNLAGLETVPILGKLRRFVGLTMPTATRNPTNSELIQSYLGDDSYGGPGPAFDRLSPPFADPLPELHFASVYQFVDARDDMRKQDMEERLNQLGRRKNSFLYVSGVPYGMSSVLGRAQSTDIGNGRSDLVSDIYLLQRWLNLLRTLVLPALYGLLGATVFQLRAILNPLLPNPSAARLLCRLALGGFAGLSTALVFGPDAGKVLEASSSYGIGTFGLAFLLGFSVDVFFSILDRLVAAASQAVSQPGKT
ncbi:MAG: hypothetical protein ACREFO_07630 [Acetobacteraceae bacterium]